MKKIYLFLTVLFVTTTLWSQTNRTWNISGGGAWNSASSWLPTGIPGTGDTVIFNNGSSGTITGVASAASLSLGKLVVTNNTSLILQYTSARTLTINNNTTAVDFTISSGSTLTMGTNINITLNTNANAAIDGTLIINAGRTYDANNGTNLTTVTGTIQNSGTISSTASTLTFASGGKYTHPVNGGTIPLATWNAASTCEVTGVTANEPAGMNQPFGNFTWNCSGQGANQLSLPATGMSVAGTFTVAATGTVGSGRLETDQSPLSIGNLSLTGGTLRIGSNTDRTITVANDVSISNATLLMCSGNGTGTLNVAGDLTIGTGGTLTETGPTGNGSVIFNGTSTQAYSKTGTVSNTIDFTINANAKVDFGTSAITGSGDFTLVAAGKIISGNSNGLSATGSIQVTGTKSFSSGADYEFTGSSTGTFTTSANPQVRDFIVNNASGNVTLAQVMTVNRTLTLTNGLLTTTSNLLTIAAGASATAATAISFVNGPLAKTGNTAFTFPVGKAGQSYRNIGISAPSSSSTFRAEFFRGIPPAAPLGSGLTQKSICEYWDLTRSAGTGTARVILSWESGSPCNGTVYVNAPGSLRVAHLSGGSWIDEGNAGTTGTNGAGTITSNVLSTFSPFTLGGSTPGQNPLPVLFANVKAYEKNAGIQIEWSNLTERDLIGYTVERSVNGKDYSDLLNVIPKNNQNDRADYTAFDASPVSGSNFYRVRVQEISGKIIYSKILRVEKGVTQQSFTLYPNPVSGSQITVALGGVKQGQYTLRVINTTGQSVFEKAIVTQGNGVTETVDMPSVKPGVYTMQVIGDGYLQSKMFIVQ